MMEEVSQVVEEVSQVLEGWQGRGVGGVAGEGVHLPEGSGPPHLPD